MKILFSKENLLIKPKLGMFCALSKNYQHLLKNDIGILSRIVWETQKWH